MDFLPIINKHHRMLIRIPRLIDFESINLYTKLEVPVQSWTEDIPLLYLVNISRLKFKNQSIHCQVIQTKHCFRLSFWIFRATRKLILRTNVTDVNAFYIERMPLEFWKSVQQLSTYRETRFSTAILNFSERTRSRF